MAWCSSARVAKTRIGRKILSSVEHLAQTARVSKEGNADDATTYEMGFATMDITASGRIANLRPERCTLCREPG